MMTFLYLKNCYSYDFNEEKLDHKEDLKDIHFADEKYLEDKKSSYKLKALYNFYRISSFEQKNSFTTDILSEFSPGFEIRYIKPLGHRNSLTLLSRYQKVIFQIPKTNMLSDNTEDLIDFGLGYKHFLIPYLRGEYELGFGSQVFLKPVRSGVAKIKSTYASYAQAVVGPEMTQKMGKKIFNIQFNAGYRLNFASEKDNSKIDAHGIVLFGVKINQKIKKNDYELGLEYRSSSFKTSDSNQDLKMVNLSFGISF